MRPSDNNVGDEGALALASALERNSTLQHLSAERESRSELEFMLSCCGIQYGAMRLGARAVVFRDVCGDACIRERYWCRRRDGACIGVGEEQDEGMLCGGVVTMWVFLCSRSGFKLFLPFSGDHALDLRGTECNRQSSGDHSEQDAGW